MNFLNQLNCIKIPQEDERPPAKKRKINGNGTEVTKLVLYICVVWCVCMCVCVCMCLLSVHAHTHTHTHTPHNYIHNTSFKIHKLQDD